MKWTLLSLLMSAAVALADAPGGREILQAVDHNMSAESQIATATLVIHGKRNSRTVVSRGWSRGVENSFTEYLAPAREKGTKMLKLADRLWLYSPDTDRTIQIAGHMLRQSVMGSDLSYEDMMENPKLVEIYAVTSIETEQVGDFDTWVLALDAGENDVAYQTRKLWVDKQRLVPVREQMYAKSGKLLKRLEFSEFQQIGERWLPMRVLYKDELKAGKGTEVSLQDVSLDIEIPDHLFSKAALRR